MPIRFCTLSAVLIPIFGLVSCTTEPGGPHADPSPAPAPVTEPTPQPSEPSLRSGPAPKGAVVIDDPWGLPDLMVSTPGGVSRVIRTSDSDGEIIDANSEFVFALKTGKELDSVELKITSRCKGRSGSYETSLSFTNIARFPMASLIPLPLFQRFNALEEIEGLQCEISGKALNTRTMSTHVFTFKKVTVVRAAQLEQLRINSGEFDLQAAAAISWSLNPGPDRFEKMELDLICDHFRNHRTLESSENQAQVLDGLVNGPPAIPTVDRRDSMNMHTCRIFARTFDQDNGFPRNWLSPQFKIRFSPGKTSFASRYVFTSARPATGRFSLDGAPLYSIEVRNESRSPLAYRFSLTSGQPASVQYLETRGDEVRRSYNYEVKVTWHLESAARKWNTGEDLVFEVLPGQSAFIRGAFDTSLSCDLSGMVFRQSDRQTYKVGTPAGFALRFHRPVTLTQLTSWNSESPDPNSPGQLVTPLAFPQGTTADGMFELWLPAREYLARNPLGSRPHTIFFPASPIDCTL
jgi:hypothetical protein